MIGNLAMKTAFLATAASMILMTSAAMAQSDGAAGDPARGAKIFRMCMACHTVKKGGPNRIGPNLHGVVGRKIASVPGFNYSPALKKHEGVWDEKTLDAWLANPRQFAPGNRMAFAGVRRPQDRKDLIAYLKSMSED